MTFLPKFSKRNSNGFTLIEILIALAIVTVITAFGIAGFINANRSNTVQQQAAELRTLARKLRTDSRAASKPVGSCVTSGTLYGSYLTMDITNKTFFSGVSCFDAGGTDYSSQTATKALKPNLTWSMNIVSGQPTRAIWTLFYSFDGQIYWFTPASATRPTFSNVTNPTGSSGSLAPIEAMDPRIVAITSGSRTYNLYFSSNGLVCEQRSTSTPTCAN